MADLTNDDLDLLESRGIDRQSIDRQVELLEDSRPFTRLARPCRIGDGIEVLEVEKQAFLRKIYESQSFRRAGFVPASGAATRMFREVLAWRSGDRSETVSRSTASLLASVARLPFALPAEAQADLESLVEHLVGAEGLDLAAKPKGLLPFHRYGNESRSAFEEHLFESAHFLKDQGRSDLHFTVSEPHRQAFESLLAQSREHIESEIRCRLDVTFSVQDPATDTLCLDSAGKLARDPDGQPTLRPGGHGSLLRNLQAVDADVVFIKNIDNIQADSMHEITASWRQVLGGYLVWLRGRIGDLLAELETEPGPETLHEASVFVERQLGVASLLGAGEDLSADWLIDRLDRPLRVCGVVANAGQTGGGPFWVPDEEGSISAQIVESAQVQDTAAQRAIFERGTHFNPVEMVCSFKDREGRPYDLERFVDLGSAFVTEKSSDGTTIKALEWPGLWNGSMAGWNTVFVEVPGMLFAPVKSVLDLLEPAHQPSLASKAAV